MRGVGGWPRDAEDTRGDGGRVQTNRGEAMRKRWVAELTSQLTRLCKVSCVAFPALFLT